MKSINERNTRETKRKVELSCEVCYSQQHRKAIVRLCLPLTFSNIFAISMSECWRYWAGLNASVECCLVRDAFKARKAQLVHRVQAAAKRAHNSTVRRICAPHRRQHHTCHYQVLWPRCTHRCSVCSKGSTTLNKLEINNRSCRRNISCHLVTYALIDRPHECAE